LQNPWKEIEESGYMIHPKDEAVIKLHNDSVDKKYRFLLHLAPEPWIGSINSSLVVLYANPGATDFDLTGKPQFKAREINRLARTNLRQEPSLFPHFFFSPEMDETQGQAWYFKTFGDLLQYAKPIDISNRLLTCEMAPYHSKNWRQPTVKIPTQSYTEFLVKEAMERRAIILIHRGSKYWLEQIENLNKYPLAFRPNSAQSPYVSKGNYSRAFDSILNAVIGD
jgi:hypothetical protein